VLDKAMNPAGALGDTKMLSVAPFAPLQSAANAIAAPYGHRPDANASAFQIESAPGTMECRIR